MEGSTLADTPDPNNDIAKGAAKPSSAVASSSGSSKKGGGESLGMDEIEKLLAEASGTLNKAAGAGVSTTADPKPYNLHNLSPTAGDGSRQPIDILGEVELDLRIELGRTQMQLDEVLQLRSGSVVALDKLAGDPVDVYVNGRLVARGEVLVMNDNFCVRVTELVGA